jgi:hypothetical protein
LLGPSNGDSHETTLKGHRRDKQATLFDLFGDPRCPVTDQILKAYEYQTAGRTGSSRATPSSP